MVAVECPTILKFNSWQSYHNSCQRQPSVFAMVRKSLMYSRYRGFITSCKEDLSVKRHLAVTNVSNHWYLFTQMEHDQRLNDILMH